MMSMENANQWMASASAICANVSESAADAKSRITKSATGSDSGGLDNG